MPRPQHSNWFQRSNKYKKTIDDYDAEIVEFCHIPDESSLSSWAAHLRNHYCQDSEIDSYCNSMGLTRKQYLIQIKFPDLSRIVSGDFAEILVADYIQYILQYFIPRTRYEFKTRKNSSTFGIDIIAFKLIDGLNNDPEDELLTCEVRAALAGKNKKTLYSALESSANDFNFKKPESLNAIKQRLKLKNRLDEVVIIERFQNINDRPYKEISGAAAVHSEHTWDDNVIQIVDTSAHPNPNKLLFVIKGRDLFSLAKALFERAANEA